MVNSNGFLEQTDISLFSNENRAFKFGDGVFETLKIVNGTIVFFEDHYFRLMASMRMLRMEIPQNFTQEFLENEILKTVEASNLKDNARIRITVYRKDGGRYTPITNKIDFLIEVEPLVIVNNDNYSVDLFKDFYVYSGLLSTVKTTNKMLNVVASIYADENELDTCLLINEKKQLVEAIHGNIFLVFGNKIVTPSITEGCVKGIIRKKLIELLKKNQKFEIEERAISPFELKKADELFITNSIIEIQSVHQYRKKKFKTEVTKQLSMLLKLSVT